MPYQDVFLLFWEQVKDSIQEDRFAKLTMAKTIGKLELKNIFVRPLDSENNSMVLVKLHYRPREIEDEVHEFSLEEAFAFLKPYLLNPFLSVILFTTTKDVTFKVNKKGVGSISENVPTFRDVIKAKSDI
ncbi:hypothetical protein Q4512_02440 [Oceanihabitans sp. 2_MG-2023]|uniref:hypothetical protein n=1 Tax=Oceanihabitans sp. 2_MG-2023 TaxID=3062661 RepID=UPI0026E358FD|nr:hypothetical protein [Oceanihabitans sp. 2_MG-2023]MDO6595755.1 hypothetical protein [Oceanihabitans sp. 2_MG-2023]